MAANNVSATLLGGDLSREMTTTSTAPTGTLKLGDWKSWLPGGGLLGLAASMILSPSPADVDGADQLCEATTNGSNVPDSHCSSADSELIPAVHCSSQRQEMENEFAELAAQYHVEITPEGGWVVDYARPLCQPAAGQGVPNMQETKGAAAGTVAGAAVASFAKDAGGTAILVAIPEEELEEDASDILQAAPADMPSAPAPLSEQAQPSAAPTSELNPTNFEHRLESLEQATRARLEEFQQAHQAQLEDIQQANQAQLEKLQQANQAELKKLQQANQAQLEEIQRLQASTGAANLGELIDEISYLRNGLSDVRAEILRMQGLQAHQAGHAWQEDPFDDPFLHPWQTAEGLHDRMVDVEIQQGRISNIVDSGKTEVTQWLRQMEDEIAQHITRDEVRAMIRQEVARALSERMGQERLSWGGVVGDIWDGLQQGDAVQVLQICNGEEIRDEDRQERRKERMRACLERQLQLELHAQEREEAHRATLDALQSSAGWQQPPEPQQPASQEWPWPLRVGTILQPLAWAAGWLGRIAPMGDGAILEEAGLSW